MIVRVPHCKCIYRIITVHLSNYFSKALRCYKKAHDLNPLCEQAGEALANVYMSLGQEVLGKLNLTF